jgi:hypothetical protein
MTKTWTNAFVILVTVRLISGCSTFKPYAQNPFDQRDTKKTNKA